MTSFVSQLWNLLQAKRLSGNDKAVLEALASFEGDKGLFPSHESIAGRSGRSVSTVIRSLQKAYALGIVERTRQRERVGNRIVNGVNRYRLILGSVEQAKVAAKQNAQRLRDALNRRKLRVFSKCQNDSVDNSQSYNLNAQARSTSDWLDLYAALDRGVSYAELGYHIPTASTP